MNKSKDKISVIKNSKATLVLNKPSPLLSKLQKDTKRFFKEEVEDERDSLFFS